MDFNFFSPPRPFHAGCFGLAVLVPINLNDLLKLFSDR